MKYRKIVPAILIAGASAAFYTALETGSMSFVHILKNPLPGQKRIACVGDSITYGYGVRHWSRNSYPARFSSLLGDRYCVNNYGYSGRTLSLLGDDPYEKEWIYRKSLAFFPDTVFLMLGTNDSKGRNYRGIAAYSEDCSRLIQSYRSLPSSPGIFLLTPLPVFSLNGKPVKFGIRGEIIRNEIRPALKRITEKEDAIYVDLYSVFEKKPEFFWDGVHPNSSGAKLLAESVYQALISERRKTI